MNDHSELTKLPCKTYDKDGKLLTVCHYLATAERDAERYRWLRHRLPVTAIHCRDECVEMMPADCGEPTDEAYASEVDAAIDAAREGGK